MVKKIYIDTSVVDGYFDEEFEFRTKIFFESVSTAQALDGKPPFRRQYDVPVHQSAAATGVLPHPT